MGLRQLDPESLLQEAVAKQEAHHRALLRVSVSLEEAAAITGATIDRLEKLATRGDVLAFSVGNGLRLPSWQLQASEVFPAVNGVVDLAAVFPGDLSDLSEWIQRSNVDLEGRSPEQALKDGERDKVIALARSIAAAGR